jgi:hypothetical protein
MPDATPKERDTQGPAPTPTQPRGITIRRLGKKEATSPGIVSGAQGN